MKRAERSKQRAEEVEAAITATPARQVTDPTGSLLVLVVGSMVLLGLRIYAATEVGFGDSEALYATYAAHPQPAYLDHPGLIGVLAAALGQGAIPSPLHAHVMTSLVATLVPWLAYGTARWLGASRRRAAIAGLVLLVVPETAVGLFGMTPDLLLAVTWLGTLLLAGLGLQQRAGSTKGAIALVGAGLAAGIASASKVSGLLLMAALVATYASLLRAPEGDDAEDALARAAVRTPWPWAGIVSGLVVLAPIVRYEAKTGWPMLQHRFVDTQHGSGIALKNLGVLLGGQLAYLSPVFAVLAVLVARDLVRERSRDPISRLLFFAFAIPILPLVALCLWSPVAEPHWIAPALLVLPLHAARRATRGAPLTSRKVFLAAWSVALVLTLAIHAWVLVPTSARLLPADADPKVDIANELYGWSTITNAIKLQMKGAGSPFDPDGAEVVVVGPHWTICGQLAAAMPGARVGCATPVRDDFDDWLPRSDWRKAEHVLFVTDSRFPGDAASQLPDHVQTGRSRVRVMRGGRTARVFELFMYERRGSASR